ncbi:MAG TPA: hypothetical protein PKD54_11520 [Pirellulaceae bacterium]|nr:hypothetical protein [Pirellulaceae bacterium]
MQYSIPTESDLKTALAWLRRVALKIIKPGMDSRQVIARFEAERQALAMMSKSGPSR